MELVVARSEPPPVLSTRVDGLAEALLWDVERRRQIATARLAETDRGRHGQYLSPPAVAQLLAGMAPAQGQAVRLLDPGCGVGSLFATLVVQLLRRQPEVRRIACWAYELDPSLAAEAAQTLRRCGELCAEAGVAWEGRLQATDYLPAAVDSLGWRLPLAGGDAAPQFDLVIANPPYRKIEGRSPERLLLREAGWEVSNLYAGFLGLAAEQLAAHGSLLAICPRSFCNGSYFRAFRSRLLRLTAIREVLLLAERDVAFRDGGVLQECLLFRADRGATPATVMVVEACSSEGATTARRLPYEQLVRPADPDQVIHLPSSPHELAADALLQALPDRLATLGLAVSTGRLVEFRSRAELLPRWEPGQWPVVHPAHLRDGRVDWPLRDLKRPQALRATATTEPLTLPNQWYVLVKRFTSKEQLRRVTAAAHDPAAVPAARVVVENHLNVIHGVRGALDPQTAQGLCAWLNSSAVDAWFRLFSGSTQVNASDLRRLPTPTRNVLRQLGLDRRWCGDQRSVDALVREVVFAMADSDLTATQQRLQEAAAVLRELGFPPRCCNRMAAVTLLAYLDLGPADAWSAATAPRRGISQVIAFAAEQYQIQYQTGTRESIRKQAVQQFLQAGILVPNPDQPDRAVNSPATVYQLEPGALALLRQTGSPAWAAALPVYRAAQATLSSRYAAARAMPTVPVRTPDGQRFALTAGDHNELIREVVEEFASRFTPGAEVLYVGDTGSKFAFFPAAAQARLAALGVALDPHGQMPDVILWDPDRNWLVLVEAVTSHGPIDAKRREQLLALFDGTQAGLVFVTAFQRREHLLQYLREISWETEVWLAEAPTHLIHFDGERFLGPSPTGEPA
ncbi:MAG: N-6 DNA methylase [Fimbriimonadaceae bacterium]|nr:N-6 DNA methylase [Fimbriimonadaceae bacterium]